jgi:hypothetical protein
VELKLFFYRLTKKFHRVVKKKKNVHNTFFLFLSYLVARGPTACTRVYHVSSSTSRRRVPMPSPPAHGSAPGPGSLAVPRPPRQQVTTPGDNSVSPSRAGDYAQTLVPRCLRVVRHAPATPLASAPLRRPSPHKPASAASVHALSTPLLPHFASALSPQAQMDLGANVAMTK